MLGILSDSLRIATRVPTDHGRPHWKPAVRFDNRRNATIEAHKLGQGSV